MIDVAAHLDSSSTVSILARLDDPHAMTVSRVFDQLWLALRIFVHIEKLLEFSIIFTFLNMECKRHEVKWIQPTRFIIDSHVIPNRLFIAQMEVVILMVRCDHVMTGMILLFCLLLLFVLASLATNDRFARSCLVSTG